MSATLLTTLCREASRAIAARFSRQFSRQSVASALAACPKNRAAPFPPYSALFVVAGPNTSLPATYPAQMAGSLFQRIPSRNALWYS